MNFGCLYMQATNSHHFLQMCHLTVTESPTTMHEQATLCAGIMVSSLQYGHEHTTLAEPIIYEVTSLLCLHWCHISLWYHTSHSTWTEFQYVHVCRKGFGGKDPMQGGIISIWNHTSMQVDYAYFLIMNRFTHKWYDSKHTVDLSHTVWTDETNIAQFPIHLQKSV